MKNKERKIKLKWYTKWIYKQTRIVKKEKDMFVGLYTRFFESTFIQKRSNFEFKEMFVGCCCSKNREKSILVPGKKKKKIISDFFD